MAHQSFSKDVLDTVIRLSVEKGGSVNATAVSHALFIQTFKAHKRMLNTLSDLAQAGRIARIKQGVYGPMPETGKVLEKREIMKNLVNIKKRVTVEDLMEAAGVSKEYAREWLRMMTANGALRKEQAPGMSAMWFRVREIAETPDDTAKAERLRKIRKQQKEQISARLSVIGTAMTEIGTILESMGDE